MDATADLPPHNTPSPSPGPSLNNSQSHDIHLTVSLHQAMSLRALLASTTRRRDRDSSRRIRDSSGLGQLLEQLEDSMSIQSRLDKQVSCILLFLLYT